MAAVNNVTHRKADPETAVFKAAPKQLNSTREKMEATNSKQVRNNDNSAKVSKATKKTSNEKKGYFSFIQRND